jgi:hypothetical protein
MVKVGRFVSDPRAGAYCHITLDGGEKVIVHHKDAGSLTELKDRCAKLMAGQ